MQSLNGEENLRKKVFFFLRSYNLRFLIFCREFSQLFRYQQDLNDPEGAILAWGLPQTYLKLSLFICKKTLYLGEISPTNLLQFANRIVNLLVLASTNTFPLKKNIIFVLKKRRSRSFANTSNNTTNIQEL